MDIVADSNQTQYYLVQCRLAAIYVSTGSIKLSLILELASIITPIIVANSKIGLNFHITMLTDYYKVNTSLGQYECHCGLEFIDSNQLTQHINSTHSGGCVGMLFLGVYLNLNLNLHHLV